MKFRLLIYIGLIFATFTFSTGNRNWAFGKQSLSIDIVPSISHHISQVKINVEKKLLVTTSQSGTIKIWRVNDSETSGSIVRTINSWAPIYDLSIAPDGQVIATAHDESIKVWDIESGDLLNNLTPSNPQLLRVRAVRFLRDGSQLISAGLDGSLRIWNTYTDGQEKIITVEEEGLKSIAVSRDEIIVATGDAAGNLKTWSLDDYRQIRQIKNGNKPISVIDFSPDNKLLAAGDGEDYLVPDKDTMIRLWDVESGKPVRAFENSNYRIEHLEFSPDGSQLLAIDGLTSLLYSTQDDKVIELPITNRETGSFIPETSVFVVAERNALVFRSIVDGSLIGELHAQSESNYWLAASSDSEIFLTINRNTISAWDVNTGMRVSERILDKWAVGGLAAAFSPDSQFVALNYNGSDRDRGKGKVELLDPQTLRVLWSQEYTRDRTTLLFGDASLSFTPDQKLISLKDDNGVLRIFDLENENLSKVISFDDYAVVAAKISANKQFANLILRSEDFKTRPTFDPKSPPEKTDFYLAKYNLENNSLGSKFELISDVDYIGLVSFESFNDSFWLTEYDYEKYSLWIVFRDGSSGAEIRRIKASPRFKVDSKSQDDKLIALSSTDFELSILNMKSGLGVQNFSGHSERISDITFTQSNERLISVAEDGTKIWNSTNGDLLATMFNSDHGEWLTITPEGFFAGSENGHELLSVVRGLEVYSVDQFYDALYDPELVKEKLAGDPDNKVLKAAEELDLEIILETGAPPRVKVLSPDEVSRVDGDTVSVTVEVSNNGGGIGRIEFFVNGVNKGKVLGGPGETITKTKELSLASETNTITVVAYNKKGLIASRPVEAIVNVDRAIVDKQPTLHVFAVGVEDYADSKYRLNYAADDVNALSRAFDIVRQDGTQYRNVKFYPLLNKDVTKGNLEAQFRALSDKVQAHDVFMFFVSGHGTAIGRKYFFIPPAFDVAGRELIDAVIEDGISQDNWRDWLGTIKAEKSLLIYDTCEAGDLTEILGRGFGDDNVAAEKLSRATGRALLTASGPSSLALEGYRKQGLLTYAILEGMAVADKDNNGVGLRELFDHVGSRVPELSELVTTNNAKFNEPYIQKPRRLMRGDDFILASTPITGILNVDEVPSLETIPTTPTHITTGPTKVYKEPNKNSEVVKLLDKFTLITKIREVQSWVLIARHGKQIGFLRQTEIEVVQ